MTTPPLPALILRTSAKNKPREQYGRRRTERHAPGWRPQRTPSQHPLCQTICTTERQTHVQTERDMSHGLDYNPSLCREMKRTQPPETPLRDKRRKSVTPPTKKPLGRSCARRQPGGIPEVVIGNTDNSRTLTIRNIHIPSKRCVLIRCGDSERSRRT